MVVDELLIAGDQLPGIELFEVVGNAANTAPAQMVGTWVKVGITFGITLRMMLPFVAH